MREAPAAVVGKARPPHRVYVCDKNATMDVLEVWDSEMVRLREHMVVGSVIRITDLRVVLDKADENSVKNYRGRSLVVHKTTMIEYVVGTGTLRLLRFTMLCCACYVVGHLMCSLMRLASPSACCLP